MRGCWMRGKLDAGLSGLCVYQFSVPVIWTRSPITFRMRSATCLVKKNVPG